MMSRKPDFIITTLQSWDIGIGSNIINIATEISRTHRVLFVNYALDRFTLLKKSNPALIGRYRMCKEDAGKELRHVNENLWVLTPSCILESINKVRPRPLFDILNRMNGKRLAREIHRASVRLGFSHFYLFTDNDLYRSRYLKELLRPEKFIYYIRDYTITTPYYHTYGAELEKEIIAEAQVVLANSSYLANYARSVNPNTYDIGQGCDVSVYDPDRTFPPLSDFPELPWPIIGYTGALVKLRLDADLLVFLAKSRPAWNFLLVGPEDEHFQQSELHSLTNVCFTGSRKPDELPAIISGFDIAINPQVVNEITIGNYPRKIDEYLALGKPVVATRTQAMELFAGHVFLADGYDSFLNGIEQSLSENNDRLRIDRINFARSHSWPENVKKIMTILCLTEW